MEQSSNSKQRSEDLEKKKDKSTENNKSESSSKNKSSSSSKQQNEQESSDINNVDHNSKTEPQPEKISKTDYSKTNKHELKEKETKKSTEHSESDEDEEKRGNERIQRVAWRTPFDAVDPKKERFEGHFVLDVVGKKITIEQEEVRGLFTVGLCVWDASIVLVKYLEVLHQRHGSTYFANKTIVELGSGCGLVGMGASVLGAKHVIFSDIGRILKILRENVERNLNGQHGERLFPYKIYELDWFKPSTAKCKPPVDLILAADVIYEVKHIRPLLKTAHKLCNQETRFLIAFEDHEPDAVAEFWKQVDEWFHWEKIPSNQLHPVYQDKDITVLRMWKKKRVE